MDEPNPYAPPTTAADDDRRAAAERGGQYYAVTPLKMVLLTVATFGFYEVYWLYKQWKAVRERTGGDISPFWRAMFDIWFSGRLFSYIREDTTAAGVPAGMSTGALNAFFVVASIFTRVAARVDVGPFWVLGFASVVPLVMLQKEINRYLEREAPGFDRNARFGAGAIVALILGVGFWGLTIVGMVMPDP